MRIIIIICKTTFLCLFLLVIDGVFGVDSDEVKSFAMTEGDSVTLNTNVTEVQRDDQILWMFGPQETRIAEFYKKNIDMFSSNETFGDRLKIDRQTGSLTITNIRPEHTGLYKLHMISNKGNSYKRFNVTVYAPLPIPVINNNCTSSPKSSSVSTCVPVCSVVNVRHATLSWFKGNRLLSKKSASDLSISLSLPLDVEDQDNNTYRCEIKNPITHQTTHLNISGICTCPPPAVPDKSRVYAVLIPAVVLALLAIVTYCIYKKRKRSGQKGNYCEPSAQATETGQINQEVVTYAVTTFVPKVQNKQKTNETEETTYAVVKH